MADGSGQHEETGAGAQRGASDGWFFCVRLQGGRYAFEASLAVEVVRLGPVTRLPAAPAFLPGVFTHRGEVLAVLDAGLLAGLGAVPIRSATRAAIVQVGSYRVALVADGVEGLLSIPALQVEPPPAQQGGLSEFLSGVGRDRRGTVALLDLAALVERARARAVPAAGEGA